MNSKLAREILNAHGDMLAQGQDTTLTMGDLYPDLETFFWIAEGLSEVLRLVPVSAEFVAQLHASLLQMPLEPQPELEVDGRRGWVIGGVAVGSAVTGLAAYALHRFMNTETAPAVQAQAA